MLKLIRIILFPIIPVYYTITWVRNFLYDKGILKQTSFNLPVIAVGNLSTGGTGKSPMVEYLIDLLRKTNKIAVLSRGYGRKTKGFYQVEVESNAHEVGDEPLQIKKKFPYVKVAVAENRVQGIQKLLEEEPWDAILLDDAFQHRKVKASGYILLTTYDQLYVDDMVLPTGNLREPKSGAKRGDIIVVTKCPKNLTQKDAVLITDKLKLASGQHLFFSTIIYDRQVKNKNSQIPLSNLKRNSFLLVTGIANPDTLISYLNEQQLQFTHLNFPDHYHFNDKDIAKFNTYDKVLCTEKDYVRLSGHLPEEKLWYQPIKTTFLFDQEDKFDSEILKRVEG
ncbi:tetraacyldisaccharide 4'-kinase [Aquimarina sp. ERC-38]|uniref:tetraacyldisaccharide 4'-kinase n=1 Tax=Aquimarina sp. ERC-38 TaxID=2949996 RepID=UPI002248011E|nr:tetraacyldisaccharide 4'-kinase [Aquimarina sp. ERC-38]UZO80583.1 tetraacyldisaccharide 4'-kinase [Aquimarina sp. ERC-38]